MDRYNDGQYLAHNTNWHQEDSAYKAGFVERALERRAVNFATCADVGCGAGLVTLLLAQKFAAAQFCGCDTSSDASAFWHDKRAPNLSFRNENLFSIPQEFDLVICLDVFEHVEDYFAFLRALRGKATNFIFNIPLDMNVAKLMTGGFPYVRKTFGHLHYFNRYTALAALEDTGYRVTDEFLTAPFLSTPPKNWRQAAMLAPRIALSALSKQSAATLTGGYSLVVSATRA